jgi:hypothetical protein
MNLSATYLSIRFSVYVATLVLQKHVHYLSTLSFTSTGREQYCKSQFRMMHFRELKEY